MPTPDQYTAYPWRVGRKVGRTIYAQVSGKPSDEDVLIGVMDSPGLAAEAVANHNATFGRQWKEPSHA